LALALGTGTNTAVFGFVDALLFRPAPGVEAPGRMVTVFTSDYSSGPIAYLVSRRTREIGVRIARGATPDRVPILVVGQGLWIAGAGMAAGLLSAALIARAAPLALYGVTPVDPTTYAAVALVLTLTAA